MLRRLVWRARRGRGHWPIKNRNKYRPRSFCFGFSISKKERKKERKREEIIFYLLKKVGQILSLDDKKKKKSKGSHSWDGAQESEVAEESMSQSKKPYKKRSWQEQEPKEDTALGTQGTTEEYPRERNPKKSKGKGKSYGTGEGKPKHFHEEEWREETPAPPPPPPARKQKEKK